MHLNEQFGFCMKVGSSFISPFKWQVFQVYLSEQRKASKFAFKVISHLLIRVFVKV